MRIIVKVTHRIVITLNVAGAVVAAVMTVMVFSGAVMRYVFGAPLKMSAEMVGLLFATMAFLAIPLGVYRHRHITIDVLSRQLPSPAAHVANAVGTVILIAFCAVFAIEAFDFAAFSKEIGSRSNIGSLLLWPWMAVMPISIGLAGFVGLLQLIDSFRVMMGKSSCFNCNAD